MDFVKQMSLTEDDVRSKHDSVPREMKIQSDIPSKLGCDTGHKGFAVSVQQTAHFALDKSVWPLHLPAV